MYYEHFKNNRGGWFETECDKWVAKIENGVYRLENLQPDDCFMTTHSYFDLSSPSFLISSTIEIIRGLDNSWFGIILGTDNSNNIHFYGFSLNGQYSIPEIEDGKWKPQQKWQLSPVQFPRQRSLNFQVIKDFNKIILRVNQKYVASIIGRFYFSQPRFGFIIGSKMIVNILDLIIDEQDNYCYSFNTKTYHNEDEAIEDQLEGGRFSDPNYWLDHTQDDD